MVARLLSIRRTAPIKDLHSRARLIMVEEEGGTVHNSNSTTIGECIVPLRPIVKIPILDRTDLQTNSNRISNNMVVIINKATNNQTTVATMVRIEVAIFSILNKTAASPGLLPDQALGRDPARRTSHRQTGGEAGISIICSGLRTPSVADHKIRVIQGAIQARVILHRHLHLC